MRTRRRFLLQTGLLLSTAATIAGCGQKGPLYLPPADEKTGSGGAGEKKPAKKPVSG